MFKIFVVIFVLLVSMLANAAVKITTLFKSADAYSKYSEDIVTGLLFALKEETSKKSIVVQTLYHDGTIEGINSNVARINQDGTDIVVGGETSQFAMLIGQKLKNKIFLTPTASSSRLSEVYPEIIRMIHTDQQYADLAKFIARKLVSKSIGVFWNTSYPNTDLISRLIVEKLEKENRVYIVKYVNGEEVNSKLLEPFIRNKVDTVMLFSYENDLRKVYSVLKSNKILPVYAGADGWGRDKFLIENLLSKRSNLDFSGVRALYWRKNREDSFFRRTVASMEKFLSCEVDAFYAIGFDTGSLISQVLAKDVNLKNFTRVLKSSSFDKMLTTRELRFTDGLLPIKDFYLFKIKDNKINFWDEVSL